MGKTKKGRKVDGDGEIDEPMSGEAERGGDEEVPTKAKAKKEKKVKEVSVEFESEDEQQAKKKKNKKAKGQDNGAEVDVDEVDIIPSSGPKTKKDKKKGKQLSVDSDNEGPPPDSAPKNKHSKKREQRKKGADSESESEAEEGVIRKTDKKPVGGFALLAMSDDDQSGDDDEDEERMEEDRESDKEEVVHVKKQDNKKGGGKKSKKKPKDEDDEDLEQILAELKLEYSGEAPPPNKEESLPASVDLLSKEDESKKGKKGKKKEDKPKDEMLKEESVEVPDEDDEETRAIKTAAQKKKEKKEKEKQKKMAEKVKVQPAEAAPVEKPERASETPEPEIKSDEKVPDEDDKNEDGDDDDKKKKKKKKGKDDKEKDKGVKGVPNKKMIAAMQEALRKLKEEEKRLKQEELDRIKKEEEAEMQRLEQLRLEQERKDRKKAKEKEKKERLKAEGKLLSSKQKADRARAEAMIEAMKAMYGNAVVAPGLGQPVKHKPFTKLKKKRPQDVPEPEPEQPTNTSAETASPTQNGGQVVEVEIVDAKAEEEKPAADEEPKAPVKDSWDAESSEEDEEKSEESLKRQKAGEKPTTNEPTASSPSAKKAVKPVLSPSASGKPPRELGSEVSNSGSSDSDSGHESESDEGISRAKKDAEKKRERALARIKQRQEDAEKKKSLSELRAAVVCVLGHVDTGKTKILDKLRRTNVQDGEAGGITQQIGATNVPMDAIKEQSKFVKGFSSMELKIPGLLIIDTPGHESFSNLRSRGSSLCDIAILVVDIMHGLEPQTIESLNLLKQRKTPFVVALNKIDRLYDWQTMNKRDVRDIIKGQAANTQLEFEQRVSEVVLQFAEQGLNAALFYNNPDVRSYVSLVPTSAITGEGMGNLLAYIVESCQTMLAKRLMFSEELQATVLEVKAIPGLGTTIDVILVNGWLREGDTAILAGTEAPIVTQIRSLLMPQPLKELRVKNAYVEYKEVKAAQGVKIAAKDLEKVIAGLNLRVAQKPDEVELLREEVGRELKHALSGIKLQERGVYVQASTLGSLEALLEFLRTSSIPYAGIRIGPVVKKDVMKASTMLEHDSQYATILAFDVKIERDAQDLADTLGVKIFQADIIYHLFDKFMAYREELKQKKRDEFKSIAVFPCKLKILPQYVFNSRDPIVMGVIVEAGIVKEGTPICVPSKEFVDIGIVTSIESNHKVIESARKGQEVCIKIEPIPGEAPKMFGRHFDEKDFLISKISRQSIDACKDYFRDDLVKTDWQLMVELKKLFQIL